MKATAKKIVKATVKATVKEMVRDHPGEMVKETVRGHPAETVRDHHETAKVVQVEDLLSVNRFLKIAQVTKRN